MNIVYCISHYFRPKHCLIFVILDNILYIFITSLFELAKTQTRDPENENNRTEVHKVIVRTRVSSTMTSYK